MARLLPAAIVVAYLAWRAYRSLRRAGGVLSQACAVLSRRGEEAAACPEGDDVMAVADAVAEPVGLDRRNALAAIAEGLAAGPAETNRRLAEMVRGDRDLERMRRLPRRLERFYPARRGHG